jgi:hypothetical protein
MTRPSTEQPRTSVLTDAPGPNALIQPYARGPLAHANDNSQESSPAVALSRPGSDFFNHAFSKLPRARLVAQQLRLFIQDGLPQLNSRLETGGDFGELARVTRALIPAGAIASEFEANRIEPEFPAFHLKGLIGFMVSSLERHAQTSGMPAGSAASDLDGVAELLIALGKYSNASPRDDHYSYWLHNDGTLSFTGDPAESYFRHVVVQTNYLLSLINDDLQALLSGRIRVEGEEAQASLARSVGLLETLIQQFRNFMSEWRGKEDFFATRMRTYLPQYPLLGVKTTPPNATYLMAWVRHDLALGAHDEDFRKVVSERETYMVDEDKEALSTARQSGSLKDLVLRELGRERDDFSSIAPDSLAQELKSAIQTISSSKQAGLLKIARLAALNGVLGNVHWAMIQRFLVKQSAKMTSDPSSKKPIVSMGHGVSGTSLDHTESLMRMRREHWMGRPLVDVLEASLASQNPNKTN